MQLQFGIAVTGWPGQKAKATRVFESNPECCMASFNSTLCFNKGLFESTVLLLDYQTASGLVAVSKHKSQEAQSEHSLLNAYTSTHSQFITHKLPPPALFAHSCQASSEFMRGKDMLYYATKYRFSTFGSVPASCSKEQDLVLCSRADSYSLPDRVAELDTQTEADRKGNKEE